jgi:xylulokinase
MKIAGLDIGTTGCKLTVFNEQGKQLDKAYRSYPVSRAAAAHEMDAGALLDGVFAVLTEMGAKHPDLAGIGVTSFGETFVLADEQGAPLAPAMLYTDPRGAEECAALTGKLGAEQIARITGLAPHEMYSLPKLMWLKAHVPALFAKAKRVLLMEDFVVWHLTGVAQIDHSLASRTMGFDVQNLTWSDEMFRAAGLDPALMSTPVPTGTPAGPLTAKAARCTGLSGDCLVVSVSHDQVAAAIGAGAFDSNVAVDGAGTVECLTPIYDSMRCGNFAVVPYITPGSYVAYAFSYTGGALLQWCMDIFGKGKTNENMEAAYSGQGPTGLLVLPHFAGAATPYMDTGSKGAILGLTTATTAGEIYRACMEGVAYEMRLNYEALANSGIRFSKLHATGGGAHSRLWMQMKADMLGLPITALETVDAGTVGCAMLTGLAVGMFESLEQACERMVRKTETYEPRPEMTRRYEEVYKRYQGLYNAVRPLV